MSIGLVLTLIFMTLKLTGHIDWMWFYVVLPALIEVVFWVVLVVFLRRVRSKRYPFLYK